MISGEVGAFDVVMQVLRLHISDAELCKNAFCALMNITVNGNSSHVYIRIKLKIL